MQDFRKLKVWEWAHDVVLHVYKLTESFPSEEKYGLTSQIRRAAVSIPTNIAEGASRQSTSEFCYFLNIASGSAGEVEYLLQLANELKLCSQPTFELESRLVVVRKMLSTFSQKLKTINQEPKTS